MAVGKRYRTLSAGLLPVVVGAMLSSTSVSAQNGTYQAPRTWFGAPDLQGTWTNNTITPLVRPDEFEALVLSREQAIALETQVAAYASQQDQPSDPDRPPPEKDQIDLADSYNNFWFDDGTRVAVYDGEYRSSLLVDPADGKLPDYTAAARTRIEQARRRRDSLGPFSGPEARPLPERCLLSFGSSSGPPMLPILYNNHYQIVQSPGYVMILVEMVHDARIIRLDDDPLPEVMTPWMGDSVGRWEGDTLVVETTRFNPNQQFRNSSPAMTVTERFTRVADDTVNYRFTVNDPRTFVSEFSGEIPLQRTDERLYEYACHEGNYALPGVLAGARIDDVEQQAE